MSNAEEQHRLHCNKCDCWYPKGPSRKVGDRCGDMEWADGTFRIWSDGTYHWENEDGTEPQPCDGTLLEAAV